MKVQVIVANLHNNGIDVEPAREESGIHKSVSYRMMDEKRDPREQLHPCRPRVWAVGFFPPGCGPDAANLAEEDVKVALTESRKGMLTCKSLRDDVIEEDSYSEAESDDYTELELREENAEEKRQYQTDGQMKVQVIVANLHNNGIDVEPAREESGCGPDAANLAEEDVKVALTESRKGMLTCKSLRDDVIEEDSYSEAESDDYTGTHKSVSYRMMDEERDPREQLHPCRPRVWAVRCFPPGCGPDAANLTKM
nr:hypothetical protein [Tanacetum cinerariifolium]